MPQSLEAEVSALGAMLLEPAVVDQILPLLRPESFIQPSHQAIYDAIIRLHHARKGIDVVPVMEELKRMGRLDAAGGAEYLAYLLDAVPSAANAVHYAEIVKEKSMQRELISACNRTLARTMSGKLDAHDLLDDAQAQIFRIAEESMKKQVTELREILKNTFEQIDKQSAGDDGYSGLPSGYKDLDDITSGLQAGDLIIVAGRPSMGKTTFAMNMVERIAIEQQKAIALFSLEMSSEQIARNMLCCNAQVDSHKLRRGMLGSNDYTKLAEAVGRLSEANVFIDDTPGASCYEIRAKARLLKTKYDLSLVVIDYMQLMQAQAESREQQIAQISRSLKELAREISVPVIAISQLNRGPESREEHRPRMSDLRESGAIEQDADVIMLIHRPAAYKWANDDDISDEDKVAEINIAKQRNGPIGLVKLAFRKECMRFEDYHEPSVQEEGGVPL